MYEFMSPAPWDSIKCHPKWQHSYLESLHPHRTPLMIDTSCFLTRNRYTNDGISELTYRNIINHFLSTDLHSKTAPRAAYLDPCPHLDSSYWTNKSLMHASRRDSVECIHLEPHIALIPSLQPPRKVAKTHFLAVFLNATIANRNID